MSTFARIALVCLASLGAVGCLNGDDNAATGATTDAGTANLPDTSIPSSDASGHVDGSGNGDTGVDAAIDATTDTGVDAPVDTGVDAPIDAPVDAPSDAPSGTGRVVLVPAGGASKSPGFALKGTVGPASAPVQRSPHYQLVGGASVSTQTK